MRDVIYLSDDGKIVGREAAEVAELQKESVAMIWHCNTADTLSVKNFQTGREIALEEYELEHALSTKKIVAKVKKDLSDEEAEIIPPS